MDNYSIGILVSIGIALALVFFWIIGDIDDPFDDL